MQQRYIYGSRKIVEVNKQRLLQIIHMQQKEEKWSSILKPSSSKSYETSGLNAKMQLNLLHQVKLHQEIQQTEQGILCETELLKVL